MMSGRKAEERNEKIIRGLMKLPPNRRCINCNALGPQYVCTDFWTFVCMICSGIHREFTHRVKSVSMSKFTAQEVEALERGGNQRARETFLHDWDPQRHRFPVSSNADKVREFIKNVYVDRKYASKKTCEKPPRNLQQDHKTHEDLTRRASSYHSYSQSPPYDYQYEERRYGKQALALTRKAGSDRGLKTSSSFSPGRLGDYDIEEKFKKGHSSSRSSDYSISSAGDPCRSYNQSPTTERGIKVSSPPSETCGDMLSLDEWNQKVNKFSDNSKVYEDRSPHLKRTASNSNYMPFSSVNSGKASGAEQAAGTHCKLTTSISLPCSSVSSNYIGLDLFDTMFASQVSTAFASQTITSSTSASGLFKSPEISSASPIDMFQPSSISLIPNVSSSAIGSQLLYSDQKKSVANFNTTSSNIVNHQYGLDLFDTDQYTHTSTAFAAQTSTSFASQTSTSSSSASDLFKSPEISSASPIDLFQPSSLSSIPNVISSVIASQPLYSDQKRSVATFNTTSSDIVNQQYGGWATFDGLQNMEPSQGGQSSTSAARPSSEGSSASDVDQYLYRNTTQQWSAFHDSSAQVTYPSMPTQWQSSPHNNVGIPSKSYQAEALSSTTNRSTNPFDIAYEYDVAPNNAFLDMSSMQGALPDSEMPTSISDDVTESWFPQGGVGLYGGPLPSAQLASIQSEGHVAPVGGNPFA